MAEPVSAAAAAAAWQSPPRALLLPYPAQGHVMPLLDLAHRLTRSGFHITLVLTEYVHARILANTASQPQEIACTIRVATVPDGLGPNDSRDDLGRLCDSLLSAAPQRLEQLIRKEEAGRPVTCIIADGCMAWALNVASKLGIHGTVFWVASAELLAIILSIPKLIKGGIIDSDLGEPTSKAPHHLIPDAPPMSISAFAWTLIEDPAAKRSLFHYFRVLASCTENAEFILCNSCLELEKPAFAFAPRILPVGPYLPDNSTVRFDVGRGSFWPEDRDCLQWLDTQPPGSVVYVAFGSLTILGARQFEELALGLELSDRPFLWVVRPGLIVAGGRSLGGMCYPPGFQERVAGRGKMVDWAPQREVLAHPAVACFLSHCGWNSIMEGVGNGVPFLCWPYFLDQIPNRDRICDVWRTGITVTPDGDGLVSKEQLMEKLGLVLGDEGIQRRAIELKKMAVRNREEGGASFENFKRFVDDMTRRSVN